MPKKIEKYYYQKYITKISIIITLSGLSILFYIFPRFESLPELAKKKVIIEIYVSDIPAISQKREKKPPRPVKPQGVIPVPTEEAELPDEITFETFTHFSDSGGLSGGITPETPARPILEEYPNVSGTSCDGYVRLLLFIDRVGNIESIEVLNNTTNSEQCLNLAVQAARKSKWLPAISGGQTAASWITKTYKFNITE